MQELLDREALEKVNVLFFLPHAHNLRVERHTPKKVSSSRILNSQRTGKIFNQNPPVAHLPLTLAKPALLGPLGPWDGRGSPSHGRALEQTPRPGPHPHARSRGGRLTASVPCVLLPGLMGDSMEAL